MPSTHDTHEKKNIHARRTSDEKNVRRRAPQSRTHRQTSPKTFSPLAVKTSTTFFGQRLSPASKRPTDYFAAVALTHQRVHKGCDRIGVDAYTFWLTLSSPNPRGADCLLTFQLVRLVLALEQLPAWHGHNAGSQAAGREGFRYVYADVHLRTCARRGKQKIS